MTVKNAKGFISRIRTDDSLRDRLNRTSSSKEITDILKELDLSFSQEEFIEAHSNIYANAQSQEIAEELQQLSQWWRFINSF